ncbi:tRNA 2-thiouridine(34) synthase MnmA [Moraxella nasovis]|uniref:tRNA 2-thiouridine(34) synthase MnmA n=1 Tax=Moraxella nasovis TaxID=2904121 RepID=UPI0021127D10|nr:tRNA 2-thiouridine(34) synthase MnmA [Moraxella nasovis]
MTQTTKTTPFTLDDIPNPTQTKVIVGMSGGVDSSVSALLLKQAGFMVEGLFMKNWEEDDGTEYCTAMTDLADAQAVCDKIGIPLHTANFASEYWDNVFEHFLAEYQAYRTPNPDILCNKEIKFKAFLDYATNPKFGLGADFIATGHYANRSHIFKISGKTYANLLRGVDTNKDQSYFLHAVGGDKLAKTLFPIGQLQKPMVRQIAEEYGLATANKKDSTGICFIGERRFKDFLQTYLPAKQGDIYSDDGQKLGTHDGLMYYTIGQRGGIGVGGVANRPDEPWFVLQKDVANNRLIVGQGHDHPLLLSQMLTAVKMDWVAGVPDGLLTTGYTCTAKTRYRQPDQACTVFATDDGIKAIFDKPQRAVTEGQSVVFYDGEVCLGGGVIENAHSPTA